MNYPVTDLIKALVTRIKSETSLEVYTIAPNDALMPYVLIEDITFDEIGNKSTFVYEVDLAYNIMQSNPTSLSSVHTVVGEIVSTLNKVDGITVPTYTMIKNDIVGTSTKMEKIDGINYYSSIVRVKYWLT